MSGIVHVVGAGLSGLAAALTLSAEGREVVMHEAAPRAGGRCRSFHDPLLDRVIDNGNHLMMTANSHVFAYLDEIGARDRVAITSPAAYPFLDVQTGQRWVLRPNDGPLPWWIFARSRRVPGTGWRDYLAGRRLLRAGPDETVADCLDTSTMLWQRFWEPLAVAALNIEATRGAASLLANTYRLTFAQGESAIRPVYVKQSLAHALIDPAVAELERRGVALHFGARVRAMEHDGDRVVALQVADRRIDLSADDRIVLAVPPWTVAEMLPFIDAPLGHTMILNLHYRLGSAPAAPPLLGLTGSVAQWLFVRDDVASVTVSAADAYADTDAEAIAARIWPDVAMALGLELGLEGSGMPPCRVIKEKRATFAQTPENEYRRPGPRTAWSNLVLAGDWTDTGLPATIEGAIQSGRVAAMALDDD